MLAHWKREKRGLNTATNHPLTLSVVFFPLQVSRRQARRMARLGCRDGDEVLDAHAALAAPQAPSDSYMSELEAALQDMSPRERVLVVEEDGMPTSGAYQMREMEAALGKMVDQSDMPPEGGWG